MERRHPRTPPVRPLVLLVDEDNDTREFYALALGSLDFETITETDGAAAYTRAWLTHPDIIVTEISLSGSDGWNLLRDLKGHPRTRDIPVAVLTAHDQPSLRARAEHEGCVAVFVKPCLPEQLAIKLRALLVPNGSNAHSSASNERRDYNTPAMSSGDDTQTPSREPHRQQRS
jgi:CheY-like chemotaxis protein